MVCVAFRKVTMMSYIRAEQPLAPSLRSDIVSSNAGRSILKSRTRNARALTYFVVSFRASAFEMSEGEQVPRGAGEFDVVALEISAVTVPIGEEMGSQKAAGVTEDDAEQQSKCMSKKVWLGDYDYGYLCTVSTWVVTYPTLYSRVKYVPTDAPPPPPLSFF